MDTLVCMNRFRIGPGVYEISSNGLFMHQSSIGHRIYMKFPVVDYSWFSPVVDIEYMKFPVMDYSWFSSVVDIEYMKFPVMDYS